MLRRIWTVRTTVKNEVAAAVRIAPPEKLPKGWETKNVQFVLYARVINNTAAQPEVLAWHVW